MAIYPDSIPYMLALPKKIYLPRFGMEKKPGYGNLVFPFTRNVQETINQINSTVNILNGGMYHVYYYNHLYKGKLASRQYNIRNLEERKEVYRRISKETSLTPHPTTPLNQTPNRNTYFEMSKYNEIFLYMTKKYSPYQRMRFFWDYFRSVWFSDLTAGYDKRWVIVNADYFSDFSSPLKIRVENPLFVLYYTMYKNFDMIKDLNIDFLIYSNNMVLKVNPSLCDEKSYIKFKKELRKVLSKVTALDSINEDELDKEMMKEDIKSDLTAQYNFTGKDEEETEVTSLHQPEEKPKTKEQIVAETKLKEKIDKAVEDNVKKVTDIVPDSKVDDIANYTVTQSSMDIEDDKELIADMYKVLQQQTVPTTPLSSARDAAMRERQSQIKIDNITIEDLNKVNATKKTVSVKDVSKSMHTINKNMYKVKFNNLNKDYIDNVMESDIIKDFTSLNNKSSKLYVRKITHEDTSNELNYKETWHIELEDENKTRHSITVDIPKIYENKFLYLGGNKKIIDRQNFLYPVVKTAPDTVQIVSNYNKMFLRRVGTKSINSVDRIMKFISSDDNILSMFTVGNNKVTNNVYVTTIEYDEFGKVLTKFQNADTIIFFNQAEAHDFAETNKIIIPDNKIFVGMKSKKPIFIDYDLQTTEDGKTICDLIVEGLPDEYRQRFEKTRANKKNMYTSATIMSQAIPLIVLLLYWEGITSVFKKMDLKYYFSQRYPSQLKNNEEVIRFKDCYFVFEQDLASSLLMSGIKILDTENYNMEDYNTQEPYLDYFKKVYGKVSIINALQNAYDFMIDHITEEILESINLPTDLVELCIYANKLLSDESYTMENSQTLSRVRSLEIIPAILYKEISNAYILYKNSNGKKKISLQKDCVIKQLLKLQTVEDYSTLNPVVELEKDRAITSKGFVGINLDRAYTEEKRSYDPSMIGVIAMSTSPDGNCGINRFLTLEPEIVNARGFVEIKENKRDELKDVNLFSPAELLYPLGNTRDDSVRIAMAGKQSKHVIPVQNATPALISNGSDEAIKYSLSSDFIVNADEDGEVVDYDAKTQTLMLKYKSGKCRAINLSPQMVKNGGGGFFLSNQLKCSYKVGDKFKKDDTIAYHKDFFKDDGINGIRMNVGTLEKVAITSSYNTYNDACMITEKLANDSKASISFCKSVVVGKNSNVYSMVKEGDHISIGDSLIDFDTSFEDSDLNKLLANLSQENKDILESNSMNSVKSKYAGVIKKIKIYSSVDVSELSESLQEIVKAYYATINQKKRFVSKYDDTKSVVKCGILLDETTGKIEPNMYGILKGQKAEDSVVIEFYIEHDDIMGVGDKLTYFTALKGIVGEVIPEGYEPYSEYRPNEEVSSIIGCSAILKRQTPSIILTVLGNKMIVELKRHLQEIYES